MDFRPSFKAKLLSYFKLFGFIWCTAIFKSCHRFSVGLNFGLLQGHTNTFKHFPLNHLNVALQYADADSHCPAVRWTSIQVSNHWKIEYGFSTIVFSILSTIHHSHNSDKFPSPWWWSPQHDAAMIWVHEGLVLWWLEVLGQHTA